MPDYAAEYTARLHGAAPAPCPQVLDHAQAQAMYNSGLDAAAAKAKASVSCQNQQRRFQLRAELSSFLASTPYGKNLQNCNPVDLLVYLEEVYIPQHAGSQLENGRVTAAPSTISNILSHLRVIFKEVGRGAVWDDEAGSGNPAASFALSQWRQGDGKLTVAGGWHCTGAKGITEPQMLQMQTHISQAAFHSADRTSHDKAVLARDGFAFSVLWQTGMRGVNGTEVTLDDFKLPGQGRGSVRAYLQSVHPVQMQHPGIMEVQPLRTKTHAANTSSISIQPASELLLDVWFWLLAVYTLSAVAGQPILQLLVRPSMAASSPSSAPQNATGKRSRGFQFLEQPLSTSGLYNRLRRHLSSIGAFTGESMHSFRKAMAERSSAGGESPQITMQRMLL